MELKENHFIKWLYEDYLTIGLYALGLSICVCVSYYLSRFIPVELFESTISPALHISMLVVVVIGAVVMQFHIHGVRARRAWQIALILWAVLESGMLVVEKFFGVSTLIFGVQTIQPQDLLVRDIMALIVLAYPAEVLCPRWLNLRRVLLLVAVPFVLLGMDYWLSEDMRVLLILYPLIVSVVLTSRIPAYKEKCEENFSSMENTAMRWIWIYMITLMLCGLSYFYLCFSNHPTRLFTQQWLVLLLLVYNTCQIICRRHPWQETAMIEEGEEENASPFPPEYRMTLETWMTKDKPYRNPEFRLLDMMQVLPLNRTYLSRFIKAEYDCNFYQLVTAYRIEEAKRLMREQPDLKMWEVAEQSGFASAVVFNRAFKRETGQTPTEWLQTIDNS